MRPLAAWLILLACVGCSSCAAKQADHSCPAGYFAAIDGMNGQWACWPRDGLIGWFKPIPMCPLAVVVDGGEFDCARPNVSISCDAGCWESVPLKADVAPGRNQMAPARELP